MAASKKPPPKNKAAKKSAPKKKASKKATTDKSPKPKSAPKAKAKTGAETKPAGPVIDPKLLSVLVCPKSRGPLTYDKAANELISKKAKLAFPIREGVPIMLIDEARALNT